MSGSAEGFKPEGDKGRPGSASISNITIMMPGWAGLYKSHDKQESAGDDELGRIQKKQTAPPAENGTFIVSRWVNAGIVNRLINFERNGKKHAEKNLSGCIDTLRPLIRLQHKSL